jgi:hypothetical protein
MDQETDEFSNIKVSTKTFTASTNITVDVEKLYNLIEVTPYIVYKKKRGRKKKGEIENVSPQVPYGSIVTVNYEGQMKGVDMKPVKKGKVRNWFRNAITVVIILDKPINFKVCKNGTFQMTGCTSDTHPKDCIKSMWDIMIRHPESYTYINDASEFQALIIPSMRNIDFDMGFKVDREALRRYLNENDTPLHCLLEPSFGYTGVNIKIPLNVSRDNMEVNKITYHEGVWVETETIYLEYINTLDEKTREKKRTEKRYNTFLVFHSGKVIFSGLTHNLMKDTYYNFVNIMKSARPSIEEILKL